MGPVAMRVVLGLVAIGLLSVASASKAWDDFVSHTSSPVQGQAINLNARRAASCGTSAMIPSSGGKRAVTLNNFIQTAGATPTPAPTPCGRRLLAANTCQTNVATLCAKGAAGTSFAKSVGDAASLNPWCYYCLTKGYGTDESTPGFYLPCGAQNNCVDVSGKVFSSIPTVNQPTTSAQAPVALTTCQAFIDAHLVTTTSNLASFHFVLWPSLFAAIVMLYFAYCMAYMQLDMDSLLYTVGSDMKKNQ